VSGAVSPWVSFHFYHHESPALILAQLLTPLVRDLLRGAISRFFFVRYSLGGPHIRLRLRVTSGTVDPVDLLSRIGREAADFFCRHPSLHSWSEDEVRRRNRIILAQDPSEHDAGLYPDNSFRSAPFHPEVERYGGPEVLSLSLDLFTLSSVIAIYSLEAGNAENRSVQLGRFFRLLASQVQGLAAGENELLAILGRLSTPPSETLMGVIRKADQVFQTRQNVFVQLFEGLEDDRQGWLLSEGAARLRQGLGSADPATRERIAVSQIHMTANRLGLGLAEELYLCRLLSLAAAEARRLSPAVLDARGSGRSLEDLVETTLQQFAEHSEDQDGELARC
jgi:hypothetical protein